MRNELGFSAGTDAGPVPVPGLALGAGDGFEIDQLAVDFHDLRDPDMMTALAATLQDFMGYEPGCHLFMIPQ